MYRSKKEALRFKAVHEGTAAYAGWLNVFPRFPKGVYLGIGPKYLLLRALMDSVKDYFFCDKCKNRDFIRIYNFSVRFRSVNFSDDLMYDEVVEERYQCTRCQKIFSKPKIDTRLRKLIDKRPKSVVATKERG